MIIPESPPRLSGYRNFNRFSLRNFVEIVLFNTLLSIGPPDETHIFWRICGLFEQQSSKNEWNMKAGNSGNSSA